MKNKLPWLIITAAVGISGCTFNVGTGNNAANGPATNSANAAPSANNATSTPTPVTKDPDAERSSANGSGDPKAPDEKIQFPRGATDVTLDRTIDPGVDKMYTFTAKKGQTLWFKVSEGTNVLQVDFNKNPVKLGEEVRESLNASGDWAIYVSNPTDKPLKYKLWIGIE